MRQADFADARIGESALSDQMSARSDLGGWMVIDVQSLTNMRVVLFRGKGLQGKSLQRTFPADKRKTLEEFVAVVCTAEGEITRMYRCRNRIVRYLGLPLRGSDGTTVAVVVWIGDEGLDPGTPPRTGVWSWNVTRATCANPGPDLSPEWPSGGGDDIPVHHYMRSMHPDDAVEIAKCWEHVSLLVPGELADCSHTLRVTGGRQRRLHAIGRVLLNDHGDRVWRGPWVDITDTDGEPVSRSILDNLWVGDDLRVGLTDLRRRVVFRWVHLGLDNIAWPDSGFLAEIMHPEDEVIREAALNSTALSALPPSVPAEVVLRLRNKSGGYDAVQVQVQPIRTTGVRSIPAITVYRAMPTPTPCPRKHLEEPGR